MAKNNFLIYDAWGTMIEALPDAMAGRVFKALFTYKETGEIEEDDPALCAILAMFVKKIDEDMAAYKDKCERNKHNAQRNGATGSDSQRLEATGNDWQPDNDTDSDTDTDIDFEKKTEQKKGRFTPPTRSEVRAYCQERVRDGHPAVNPEQFCDFYESNGWKVGKNTMKDWKAAVRTWEQRNKDSKPRGDPKIPTRDYDFAELERRLVGR